VDVAETDDASLDLVEEWRGHPLAVRTDPRAHLLRADGRRVLEGSPGHWHVVASQPSQPWSSGSGHLFTRELVEAARAALAPGGVYAQWLDLGRTSPDLLAGLLRPFVREFADVWVFRFDTQAIVLGFSSPARLDPKRWEEGLRGVSLWSPERLWGHLALDTAKVRELVARDTPEPTDDRPLLELRAGVARLLGRPAEGSVAEVARFFPPDVAAILPDASLREAWSREAVALLTEDGRLDLARAWESKVRLGTVPEALRVRGLLVRAEGDTKKAAEYLREAYAKAPDSSERLAEWVLVLAESLPPASGPDPLAAAVRAVEARRGDGPAWAALAAAYVKAGVPEKAEEALHVALEATSPAAPPGTRAALARLQLAHGRTDERGALVLLRDDPLSMEDVDVLSFRVRLEFLIGADGDTVTTSATEAMRLSAALDDRARTAGQARIHAAASALDRGDRALAVTEATRAVLLLPRDPRAHEERAFAGLAFGAAGTEEALVHLRRSVELARDPGAARERARRILRWHGVDPERLDPPTRPASGAP
jgi:tetratricopeptide (TPR) repeat protein